MKKTALLIVLIVTAFAGKGQNLVPNGDFEQYDGCPTAMNQFDSLLFWFNPTNGTPDYFNSCAPLNSSVSIPYNQCGYQQTYNGEGYCGIVLYAESAIGDYHEYAEVQLTSILSSNTCYHFEMYINLSNLEGRYTTDDIGVYFSDTIITGIPNWFTLSLPAQINNVTGNYPDSANWILVSGNYTATGSENYMILGNFKNNANTDTILYNNTVLIHHSYVYIDDVSLTPCTGIEEQNQNEAFSIYPNPAKEYAVISSEFGEKEKTEIIITDILGKEIYRDILRTPNYRLPTYFLNDGIYFIEINNGKNIYRKKFLKE